MAETNATLHATLTRIADALERLAPETQPDFDLAATDAFVWHAETGKLEPIGSVNRIPLHLLKSIDRSRDILLENTRRFAAGYPANNALLWGARGMGKSSIVKALHATVSAEVDGGLKLIEIHREDIPSLPTLLKPLRNMPFRCLLFCDDLSFDADDSSYKSLKAVLDGGIEGRPDNVIIYATSNRRHLMPRDMMENERSTAINPSESVEEKVSLSDRFGLWLGFHNCNQKEFLDILDGYCTHFGIAIDREELKRRAVEWSVTRGARNGRVAWQFIQDLAGEKKIKLSDPV